MVSGDGLLRISARKLQNVQRNHGENIPRKIPATEGSVNETLGSCNVYWENKLSQNSRDVLSVGMRCNRSKWSGQALRGLGNGNRETGLTPTLIPTLTTAYKNAPTKNLKLQNSQLVFSELLHWRAKETSRAFREAKWSADKESETSLHFTCPLAPSCETSSEDKWSSSAIKESD